VLAIALLRDEYRFGTTKFLTSLLKESAGIALVASYAICWQKRESKNSGQLVPVQVRSLFARG